MMKLQLDKLPLATSAFKYNSEPKESMNYWSDILEMTPRAQVYN